MLMKNKQMSFNKAQLPAAKATWAAGGPRRQPPARLHLWDRTAGQRGLTAGHQGSDQSCALKSHF